jgi:tRNA threonylcarbamoyladenosine biosynthesis protein TsaE
MPTNETLVTSVLEMHKLGQEIGSKLQAGDLIILTGPLGSGKTALTQGIGRALGITDITSPTFVISKIYPGKIRLVHVDAYRLQGESAAIFDDLDLESYLNSSITVVEWGEGLADRFSSEYLELQLNHGPNENDRFISATPHGKRWDSFSL